MMNTLRFALIGAVGLMVAPPSVNAAQYVYPLQGQDLARQASDEADCADRAVQQTGFDPVKPQVTSPQGAPTGTASDTSASVLGAIPGNGLQGGPAGALGGGGPGEVGTATNALVNDVGAHAGASGAEAAGAGALGGPRADYDQARAACLTSRGYSVH